MEGTEIVEEMELVCDRRSRQKMQQKGRKRRQRK